MNSFLKQSLIKFPFYNFLCCLFNVLCRTRNAAPLLALPPLWIRIKNLPKKKLYIIYKRIKKSSKITFRLTNRSELIRNELHYSNDWSTSQTQNKNENAKTEKYLTKIYVKNKYDLKMSENTIKDFEVLK